ncbi:MAG: metallophosphoesterase family protein [Candidatus Woesearchaeota archaeon]
MQLLVFADSHGQASVFKEIGEKSKKADVVICVGDFTFFGHDTEKWMNEMNSWEKPVIIVHGNHESEREVSKLSKSMNNITFIHKSYSILNDIAFIGYGGDGFSEEDPSAEIALKAAAKICRGKKIVMVLHQPPHGTNVDYLPWLGHVGNQSYTKAIMDIQPIFAFSGHLHETFGKKDEIGKTIIANPGPRGQFFEL